MCESCAVGFPAACECRREEGKHQLMRRWKASELRALVVYASCVCFIVLFIQMEKVEATSELQSRLSSLSVSSFSGIASKTCDSNPLDRYRVCFTSTRLFTAGTQWHPDPTSQLRHPDPDSDPTSRLQGLHCVYVRDYDLTVSQSWMWTQLQRYSLMYPMLACFYRFKKNKLK